MKINFDFIWKEKIKPLEGLLLKTLDEGSNNRIIKVTDNYLERDSPNNTPPQKIPKDIFKAVYEEVMEKGELSRVDINKKYPKRYSSIICAVLVKLDGITYQLKPIKLVKR